MSTNIKKAGIDTLNFLPKVVPSNYSQVQGLSSSDFSFDLSTTSTEEVTSARETETSFLVIASADGLLTGTHGAVLPMTITLSDRDNNKISFVLLINPENINHGKTNAVYAGMARQGFITQMWGPNQDLLTGTGKTAGFYTSGVGLTDINSQRSFGFKNFMAFFSTYRNNGYELLDQTNLNNLTRVINVIHGIEIDYDGQTFLGHFNNFTLDDSADSPFIFNYNFEFVVSSLSTDYNEIRGHFIPPGEKIERKPRLVSKVGKTELNEGQFQDPISIGDTGRAVDIVEGTQGKIYGINALPQYTLNGIPADVVNLEPNTKEALLKLARVYKDTFNVDLPISSGRRTMEQQQKLWDAYIRRGKTDPTVAEPNPNNSHIRGIGIDISLGKNADGSTSSKITDRLNSPMPPDVAKKYGIPEGTTLLQYSGLIQPLPDEDPVHFRLPLKGEKKS
jgi:hypothetical protein